MLDHSSHTKLTHACAVSFYNDHKSLKRCLDSIAGNFEYVFALDGRYEYLVGKDDYFDNPLSTDGSREVVECYEDKRVVLIDVPDTSESKKRQRYCEVAKIYGVDLLLILDSDEWVWFADWQVFRDECYQKVIVRDKGLWNIYNVACRDGFSFMDRPRLWFKPYDIGYGTTHYELYNLHDPTKALINMGGDTHHLIDHMCIRHDDRLRSLEHRFARQRWEHAQQKVEDHVRFGEDFSGLKTVKHAL